MQINGVCISQYTTASCSIDCLQIILLVSASFKAIFMRSTLPQSKMGAFACAQLSFRVLTLRKSVYVLMCAVVQEKNQFQLPGMG